MQPEYYTLSQAAALLGTKQHRINYLLINGQIPEPYQIGGRRLFTLPELATISTILKLDIARELQAKAARRSK